MLNYWLSVDNQRESAFLNLRKSARKNNNFPDFDGEERETWRWLGFEV
jgi:hypothetical protein